MYRTSLSPLLFRPAIRRYCLLIACGWLLGAGNLQAQSAETDDALTTFLKSPQAQLRSFDQMGVPAYLRDSTGIYTIEKKSVLELSTPTKGAGKLSLHIGRWNLDFRPDTAASGKNYFVPGSDAEFDRFVNAEFPALRIVDVGENGLQSFSYNEKKAGTKGYQLGLVLPQMGIAPEVGGNLEYGKLDNLRDALASSLVQRMLKKPGTEVVYLSEGKLKTLAGSEFSNIKPGETLLLARYDIGRFAKVAEDRSQMLWMLLGMLIGGAIMSIVLLMARGKKGKEEVGKAEESVVKPEVINEVERGELATAEMKAAVKQLEEIKKRLPEGKADRLAPDLDVVIYALQQDEAQNALAATAKMLGLKAPETAETATSEHPVDVMASAMAADLEKWDSTRALDKKIAAKLRLTNQIFPALSAAYAAQGSEAGKRLCAELQTELAGHLLSNLAIVGLRENKDPETVRKKIRALHAEIGECGLLKAPSAIVQEDLLPVLAQLAGAQQHDDAPDPVTEYFELLRERFGNLTARLGRIKDSPPTAAEEAAYMSDFFQAALHLNDFVQVYLDSAPNSTAVQNQRLVLENKSVADLNSSQYTTFTEAIDLMPLSVRNFRYLARKAGVRSMDQVLINGYHIPSTALAAQ